VGSISLHTEVGHCCVITVPGQDCHCQRPSWRARSWQKKPWLGGRHLKKVHCPSVEADEVEAELWITYLEATSLHCWSNCRGHLVEATTSRDSVNDGVKILWILCWWLPPLLAMQQYRWEPKHDTSVQRNTRVNWIIAFMPTLARWFGVNGPSSYWFTKRCIRQYHWDCKRRFKLSVFFWRGNVLLQSGCTDFLCPDHAVWGKVMYLFRAGLYVIQSLGGWCFSQRKQMSSSEYGGEMIQSEYWGTSQWRTTTPQFQSHWSVVSWSWRQIKPSKGFSGCQFLKQTNVWLICEILMLANSKRLDSSGEVGDLYIKDGSFFCGLSLLIPSDDPSAWHERHLLASLLYLICCLPSRGDLQDRDQKRAVWVIDYRPEPDASSINSYNSNIL